MALTSAVSSSQSERITLGQAVDGGASQAMFQVWASPTWTGSFVPNKRLAGAASLFMTSSYTNHFNGSVSNAPITGSGIFSLDITGCDVVVQHSMTTSGSLAIVYSLARS